MSEVVKARQCFQEREWIEIFKARKACRKTVTQFCKDENITESKYYYWLKKIRVQALTRTDIPERQQIVPIQLASDTAAATSAVNGQSDICIRIGEISIEIREGVSSGTIRDVLSAVRQSC